MADRARCCAGLTAPCHPARQSARASVFRGRRLSPLSPTGRRGSAACRHSSWACCLMPNHVHLPIIRTWRDAGGRGRVTGDLCRSTPALHRGHQRSLLMDGPFVPESFLRGGDGASAWDRILDQLVVFGGITPLAEVKDPDEMVIVRGTHGGIGGDNGCRRCRNSSVSMVKSQ